MASTLDVERARAALLMAAGVTTAAAIVLSQRSIRSIMASVLKVGGLDWPLESLSHFNISGSCVMPSQNHFVKDSPNC